MLWPLHLRKLDLGSHDLAWLQLTSQLLIIVSTLGCPPGSSFTSACRYPPLTRLLGHRSTASLLPLLASLCSALAFLQPEASFHGRALHVVNVLSFLALCGAMKAPAHGSSHHHARSATSIWPPWQCHQRTKAGRVGGGLRVLGQVESSPC